MRRLAIVLAGLLLLVGAPMSFASATDRSVHFASTAPVTLGSKPALTSLLNDSVHTYKVIAVRAEVSPDAVPTNGRSPMTQAVDVQFAVKGKFEGFVGGATQLKILPGGVLTLRLTGPTQTTTGGTGWLTVTLGRRGRAELVARQPLSSPSASPPVATGLTSWSFKSISHDLDASGTTHTYIPLLTGKCADAKPVSGVLIDGDQTATVTSSKCGNDTARIGLDVTGIAQAGTYAGTIVIGDDKITLSLTRTLHWIWPVLAILCGMCLALLAQGATDRGWSREDARWLRQLQKDAKSADKSFASAAADKSWAPYRIEQAVLDEVDTLAADRDTILKQRGALRRFLPWPANFMAPERTSLHDGTARADKVVRDWHTTPDKFNALPTDEAAPELHAIAPMLKARRDQLRGGVAPLADIDAVEQVIAELTSWPDATKVVSALATASARLSELAPGAANMVASDRAVLEDAVRSKRAITTAIKVERDATVVARLAPQVTALVAKIAGLPTSVQTSQLGVEVSEVVYTETVLTTLPLDFPKIARAAAGYLSSRGDNLLNLVMIALTVAVALWTGLTILYIDKAWGSAADFAAAAAWGFGTAALLTPVITAVRQWGTRIADPADPA